MAKCLKKFRIQNVKYYLAAIKFYTTAFEIVKALYELEIRTFLNFLHNFLWHSIVAIDENPQ